MHHRAATSREPGYNELDLLSSAAAVVEVVTVSVVEPEPPEGVTVAGEKLHEAPAGIPSQLKDTPDANELTGVTVTVASPLCPPTTVSEPGEIAMEKLGGPGLITYAADPTPLVE
jgi:hypothetical protein